MNTSRRSLETVFSFNFESPGGDIYGGGLSSSCPNWILAPRLSWQLSLSLRLIHYNVLFTWRRTNNDASNSPSGIEVSFSLTLDGLSKLFILIFISLYCVSSLEMTVHDTPRWIFMSVINFPRLFQQKILSRLLAHPIKSNMTSVINNIAIFAPQVRERDIFTTWRYFIFTIIALQFRGMFTGWKSNADVGAISAFTPADGSLRAWPGESTVSDYVYKYRYSCMPDATDNERGLAYRTRGRRRYLYLLIPRWNSGSEREKKEDGRSLSSHLASKAPRTDMHVPRPSSTHRLANVPRTSPGIACVRWHNSDAYTKHRIRSQEIQCPFQAL